MKLKLSHYLIAIAVIAAVYWFYPKTESDTTGIAGYQTKALSIGKIESLVNSAGTLSPVVTVEVGSEISGLVRELNADYNSEVTAGEVIARIDDRTVRAQLKQNEADLAVSIATLNQQKANLKKAEADIKLSRAEFERQKDLRERGLTSQSDLDKAEATYLNSQAQISLVDAQVAGAEASILQREAQVEQTKLNLERTYIRSPVTGTVIDRQVDVGQTVAASLSAPILFEIAQDLTKMQIEADVDEADIGKMTEGLAVRFTVDAFPENEFNGEVTQVRKASTITSNVVTYKVIISAANPRQQLLPGMTANVDLILGEKNNVLRVDNSALRFTPAGIEAADADNGQNRDTTAQIKAAMEDMNLSSNQQETVLAAVTEMQESFSTLREAASNSGGFGGPSAGDLIGQARTRMNNKLGSVLSEEQVAALSASLPGGNRGGGGRGENGGGRGGNGGERTTTGQVWVLENNEPVAKSVRVGLSDDQYSEITSDELEEGDEVILRAIRVQ